MNVPHFSTISFTEGSQSYLMHAHSAELHPQVAFVLRVASKAAKPENTFFEGLIAPVALHDLSLIHI